MTVRRPGLSSRRSWIFFVKAEDGIRDVAVTGVQTCALPISGLNLPGEANGVLSGRAGVYRYGRAFGAVYNVVGDLEVGARGAVRVDNSRPAAGPGGTLVAVTTQKRQDDIPIDQAVGQVDHERVGVRPARVVGRALTADS